MAIDLARLRTLHAAANQGEWKYTSYDETISSPEYWIGTDVADRDGDYIVALHNAAPSLIARAELLDRLVEVVEDPEGGWDEVELIYNSVKELEATDGNSK